MRTVLVTGDRTWTDRERIGGVLEEIDADVLVVGDATGADEIARWRAHALGMDVRVFAADLRRGKQIEREVRHDAYRQSVTYAADWSKQGKAAGPIRNRIMLICGKPDQVLAFHNDLEHSRGTKNCVEEARKRGIPVTVYTSEGETMMAHLWEFEHPYTGGGSRMEIVPSWDEFEQGFNESNTEWIFNHVYRWDWTRHVAGLHPDRLRIWFVFQRKDDLGYIEVHVTPEDEERVKVWLQGRWQAVQTLWEPISRDRTTIYDPNLEYARHLTTEQGQGAALVLRQIAQTVQNPKDSAYFKLLSDQIRHDAGLWEIEDE